MEKNKKNNGKINPNDNLILETDDIKNLKKLIINRLEHHPFSQSVGINVLSIQYRKSIVALKVGEQHLNPNGTIHGGVLMTLADNAAGAAVLYTGQKTPTLDLHYRFLKPVYAGDYLIAEAEVVQSGGRIVVIHVKIENDHQLVGDATASFYKLDSHQKEIPSEIFEKVDQYIRENITKNKHNDSE